MSATHLVEEFSTTCRGALPQWRRARKCHMQSGSLDDCFPLAARGLITQLVIAQVDHRVAHTAFLRALDLGASRAKSFPLWHFASCGRLVQNGVNADDDLQAVDGIPRCS
eukprot:4244201-Amphidinium_carterae.1